MEHVDELSEGELGEEVAALKERLALLSEVNLRINESLDVETVLQGVLDSARLLVGARYGLICLVSSKGGVEENLYSGITPEQARELWEMPHAETFQSHIDEFEGTFRIADLHSHVEAAGLPEFRPPVPVNPVLPLLAVSIRYRGDRVGVIYLGDKEQSPTATGDTVPGFTARDEEAISMFAAQAALVISKARIHREEQRARAHFETLLNTTPVGVLVFEPEHAGLLYANREAERIFGDLLISGGSLSELLDTATFRSAQGRKIPMRDLPVGKVLRSGEVIVAEEVIVEAEGHSITAMVNATPVLSDEGVLESVVASVQDITPIAELERLRAEFLGMVGHELRTPLAGIKGSASTLLEAGNSLDPAETHQYYRIINEQADYMRDLIADLIDVVRIETGSLSVHPEPTDVARLVDESRNSFLSAGGRDNVRINLHADLSPVMADRRRVTQVINNLLINAARSSHESSPIWIDAVMEDLHVAISVVDSGKGLSAERLPYLFQKFSTPEDRQKNRDLGLGLAICKGIVEAHGGRIWAESDGPGLGSRFSFTVPTSAHMPASAAAERVHAAAASGSPSHEQTRVLAVDDDPRLLKHVRDSLSKAGYSPVVTGDPGEVLSLIAETSPHVVLLDLMLPGSDGVELMQDIHAAHDTPVIFLSAYDQDELIAKAFENGAVDYIVKPFSPTELAARVNAALRKKAESPNSFKNGDLVINYAERSIAVAGRRVELTPIEYRLLVELATNLGSALTHEQLLLRVWGSAESGDARPLRTTVKNLRRKLGDEVGKTRFIVTVPRVGYRMPRPDLTG